jgi:hypothetical protein
MSHAERIKLIQWRHHWQRRMPTIRAEAQREHTEFWAAIGGDAVATTTPTTVSTDVRDSIYRGTRWGR